MLTYTSIRLPLLVLLISLLTATSRGFPASPFPRVGVIFDSGSSIQFSLQLATWMGFRDTLPNEQDNGAAGSPSPPPPHILDVSRASNLQDAASWLLGNHTERLVSLLEPQQLVLLLDAYAKLASNTFTDPPPPPPLSVVLPRECLHIPDSTFFQLTCLQLDEEATALALVHRAIKVGVTRLLPITLNTRHKHGANAIARKLYRLYKQTVYNSAGAHASNLNLAPVSFGLDQLRTEIKIHNQLQQRSSTNSSSNGGAMRSERVLGILVLDREPEALAQILKETASAHEQTQLIYTFTPWGVDTMLDGDGDGTQNGHGGRFRLAPYLQQLPYVNRLYTVVGGGTRGRLADPKRIRLLQELSEFIGPNPLIFTALVAYDAATLITQQTAALKQTALRRSGLLYGISPKPGPAILASNGALLQPSDFILEDEMEIVDKSQLSNYYPATSSILSRQDLATLAFVADSRLNCTQPRLQVTSYDPFTSQPAQYTYDMQALPQYLLIPNTYGYGLELECVHNDHQMKQTGQNPSQKAGPPSPVFVTNLRIACVPAANGGASVTCHRSNWIHRERRSSGSGSGRYILTPRDDSSAMAPMEGAYYQPYMAMAMADMTTAEPPTNPPPPPPPSTPHPGPPPPDLRQVIKAAKPFVGGCIGSSLGCAVCVLVLGRLALGSSPAICSGPCFAGVFGQCGALLGRVGSETTIICTELFKQGHIDIATFLADAEFGAHMRETAPLTLHGYQVLASPIVQAMRVSPTFTEFVAVVAGSWAEHMKTLVGRADAADDGSSRGSGGWTLGAWLHAIGVPICSAMGYLVSYGGRQLAWTSTLIVFGGLVMGKSIA